MAADGIQRFANRVRIFLVGIVLVLLAFNILNGVLVRRTLAQLKGQFEEKVRARATLVLQEQGRDRLLRDLEHWRKRPADLPRLDASARTLRRHGLLSLQVVSPEGVVLEGNTTGELLRHTHIHQLEKRERSSLRRGTTVVGWPTGEGGRDDVVEVFQPLLDDEGGLLAVVRSAHDANVIRGTLRDYRLALWVQMGAVVVLLLLAMAFARWMLRPLHLLQRTAKGEALPAGADPTNFLLDTYRKIISDLQGKEEELRELRGQERKRALRLQALNRSIVDSLPSAVLVVGADGTVRETNRAAAGLLDLEEDPSGLPYQEALSAWPEVAALVTRCLEDGEAAPGREMRAARRGGAVWIEAGVSPLRGSEEGGALLLLADRTRAKDLERRMQRREMLADLGELSAGVAHEFRNALGTILGYARLLARRGESAEEAEAIEEEVHALERVVRDFLRFADPTRLVLTGIDLEALIRSAASEAERDGVEIRVEGRFPNIRGDETLLKRTFRNLLRNAVEAIPPDRQGLVTARGSTGEGKVRVEVMDNGRGIGEKERERLFQPFFTTKAGGTGLGLALVQKIVLSHNGDIRHDPAPGGGSVFTVSLPLQEEGGSDGAEAPGEG